jgi:alkylhydroperoxidase family enzyme
VQAHANDLRDEIANDWNTLTNVTDVPDDATLDDFTHTAVRDWRKLPVAHPVMSLLAYAEKITKMPAQCAEDDVLKLKNLGWSDSAIHDAVQVVGYFNYINRIADALGVEPEPEFKNWGA